MSGETLTGQKLRKAAEAIDSTASWQFLGAGGNAEEDDFTIDVVSNGPVPLIDGFDFEGLDGCVAVHPDPTSNSFNRIHFISYAGNVVGLELFVHYLCQDLDGISEGHTDMAADFVARNPLWLVRAVTPQA